MNWDAILNGALGAGVIGILAKLIDAYSNRHKTRADAAKIIVEGGAQAVKVMREVLEDYDKINDEQRAEIEALNARLSDRERQSRERDAQFADQQQKNEDLEVALIKLQNQARETDEKIQRDTEETQRLRNDYAIAQKQILRLEDLVIAAGEYIDKMKAAIQKANIDIPLNGELLDSVHRLKLDRAQRGKQ